MELNEGQKIILRKQLLEFIRMIFLRCFSFSVDDGDDDVLYVTKKFFWDSCEANQIELSLASDLITMNSPTLEIPTTSANLLILRYLYCYYTTTG